MTIPSLLTEGSQVVTAAGIVILALRQGDMKQDIRDLWTELNKLREWRMNGGKRD